MAYGFREGGLGAMVDYSQIVYCDLSSPAHTFITYRIPHVSNDDV